MEQVKEGEGFGRMEGGYLHFFKVEIEFSGFRDFSPLESAP
jgi:hypothetical protein